MFFLHHRLFLHTTLHGFENKLFERQGWQGLPGTLPLLYPEDEKALITPLFEGLSTLFKMNLDTPTSQGRNLKTSHTRRFFLACCNYYALVIRSSLKNWQPMKKVCTPVKRINIMHIFEKKCINWKIYNLYQAWTHNLTLTIPALNHCTTVTCVSKGNIWVHI